MTVPQLDVAAIIQGKDEIHENMVNLSNVLANADLANYSLSNMGVEAMITPKEGLSLGGITAVGIAMNFATAEEQMLGIGADTVQNATTAAIRDVKGRLK